MSILIDYNRFDNIMAGIDAWAEEFAGWDCRADVVYDVEFMLQSSEFVNMSDAELIEHGIAAWQEHE